MDPTGPRLLQSSWQHQTNMQVKFSSVFHGRQICRKRIGYDGQRVQKRICGGPTKAFKSFHLVCVCSGQITVLQGVWRPQSSIMGFGGRHCYVCDSEVTEKNGYFEHMEGHKEDLKMFKFSNNTSDACRTQCKLCGKMFQLQRMRWRKSYKYFYDLIIFLKYKSILLKKYPGFDF